MKEERIIFSDILRIVAAFFVILIHVTCVGLYDYDIGSSVWTCSLVLNSISRWCVPVFFMLSGIFFLDPKRGFDIRRFFLKNFLRIILCLAVWGFFYSILDQYLYGTLNVKSLLIALYGIVTNHTGGYQLWFLYTLLILYLETPILRVFTSHATKRQLEYTLLVWFVCSILLSQVNSLASEWLQFQDMFAYSALTITAYSGYYLLGHYLICYPLQKRVLSVLLVMAALSAVLMPLANVVLAQHFGLRAPGSIHTPLGVGTCFMSVALFSLAQKIDASKWKERTKKCVATASKHTFGIYLVHVFFVSLVFRIICVPLTPVMVVFWTAAIYGASYLVAFLLSKIPLVQKIV